ncbi:MAG TPA: patatin-like phospholipase family protein [Longimicrobiales bacterium]|nr:patatin-like phospholipase family protein [Longimicrobiales bacterium]
MQAVPRRILALDGGGVRGVVSVEVLRAVESLLRAATGDPDLRLADWFDLIAGTSVGAITATLLATGREVDEVARFYAEHAGLLFQPAGLRERLHYRYDAERLAGVLRDLLGADATLGSDRLRTLLLLVLRNTTTDSPWLVTNNPSAKFNDRRLSGCNLDLPLWQLVRASTAAPVYFAPEVISIGGERFIFSDGGLTGYNNPAFEAFLTATVEPYGLSWPAGADRLLVVSVGTATPSYADPALQPSAMHLLYHIQTLPLALLSSAAFQQDLLCRVFGDCLVGDPLDLEVGDLIGARGPVEPKLFTYVRYNVALTAPGLEAVGCGHLDPVRLAPLDVVANLAELRELGAALARARVRPEHFARFLSGPAGRGAEGANAFASEEEA